MTSMFPAKDLDSSGMLHNTDCELLIFWDSLLVPSLNLEDGTNRLSEMLVFLSIPKEGAKISTTDAFHQLL